MQTAEAKEQMSLLQQQQREREDEEVLLGIQLDASAGSGPSANEASTSAGTVDLKESAAAVERAQLELQEIEGNITELEETIRTSDKVELHGTGKDISAERH